MIDYLKGWDKENYRPLEVLDAKRGWAVIACNRDGMIYSDHFDYDHEEMRSTCLYQYRRAIHRFKALPEYPIPG